MRTRSLVIVFLCALLGVTTLAAPARAEEPSVAIVGPMEAGWWVGAEINGVAGPTTYAWMLDGVPVPQVDLYGEPTKGSDERRNLLEEYIGKELVVTVTVTPSNGSAVTLVSPPRKVIPGTVYASVPSMKGEFVVGKSITAVEGDFTYPLADLDRDYQWFVEDKPVAGATGKTWVPGKEFVRRQVVKVRITYSKPGWKPRTVTSDPFTGTILPGTIDATRATIVPDPVVGGYVAIDNVDWLGEPGLEERFDWFVDGKLVAAETQYLTIRSEWYGKTLTGRATLTRRGNQPVVLTTPPKVVGKGTFDHQVDFERPVSRESLPVGWVVRAEPLDFGFPTKQSVQWFHSGVPIPGATGWNYRLTADDLPFTIQARYTVTSIDRKPKVYDFDLVGDVTFNVYTTPGDHVVNGRKWRTSCEKYSTTIRCRAEILATQVVKVDGRWTQRTGYVFNNLTYLPLMSGTWGKNPLANTGSWVDANGRGWRTECNTATTGRGGCRTYIVTDVTRYDDYNVRYVTERRWVFNNVVYLR